MPTFRRSLLLGAVSAALASPSAAAPTPRLVVAYPPDGHRVAHDHVILEGSVGPGARLTVGGRAAEVAPDGLFTLWWPLSPGLNTLRLVTTSGGQSSSRTVRVTRTVAAPLPARPTAIRPGSLNPAGRLEFWDLAGDAAERQFEVSFEGSPGGRASFRVGGGNPQAMYEPSPGNYRATVLLSPGSVFDQAPVTVSLTGKDGKTVTAAAPGRVSTGTGPATATQQSGTVRGLGVNEAGFVLTTLDGQPLLYPREGMTFLAVGRQGDDLRVRLAPGLSALVTAEQVALTRGLPLSAQAGPLFLDPLPPGSVSPGTATDDLRLRLPLGGARLPFTLEQQAGGRRLDLTLYGAPVLPAPTGLQDPLLQEVGVTALGLGVQRVSLTLNAVPWGFHAAYEGGDLVLTVRRPPVLDPAQPLTGRVIVLDPGHGGSNLGGAGLLGIPEKGLTLPVALRAAELLRAQGATVHLTRERDEFVGLTERGLLAEQTRADLLVSLHYNALPDGRDPRGIRGPEVYFTHPQAEALATTILRELRTRLPELGPGAGLKPGANLALTRPSTQLSLLVELAYLTDAGNVRTMHSPAGQEKLAQAVAAGIAQFYAAQAAGR